MNFTKLFFALLLMTFILGCDKEPETPAQSKYYFTGTLGSEDLRVDHNAVVVFHGGAGGSNGDFFCSRSYVSSLRSFTNENSPGVSINFENLLVYDETCDFYVIAEDFPTAFTSGNYNYRDDSGNIDGSLEIFVEYRDENEVYWSTTLGPQSTDASFAVTESGETTSTQYFSEQMVEVKCTFECTLYNEDGDSLELSNGEAFYIFFND